MRRLRLLVLLAVALVAAPAAASWSPAPRTEERLRADFAAAFGVDPALVVDVAYYELPGSPGQPGFLLGRFREKAGADWVFPGLAVYFDKGGKTYLAREWLGAAADALKPLTVVDLDAKAATSVRWRGQPAPASAKRKWPALVLVAERQGDRPAETDLVVVSLRDREAPKVLLTRTLESRWPESKADRGRPAAPTVGRRVEGVRFERDGDARRVVFTERAIASRFSRCREPQSYEVTYALGDPPRQRYLEVRTDDRPRPCP